MLIFSGILSQCWKLTNTGCVLTEPVGKRSPNSLLLYCGFVSYHSLRKQSNNNKTMYKNTNKIKRNGRKLKKVVMQNYLCGLKWNLLCKH
jgi:hypothetical protein